MDKNRNLPNIISFEDGEIRRVLWEDEWYYSISDVLGIITKSKNPKAYWRQVKKRDNQLVTYCHGLKLLAADGKYRKEDCANRKGLFRILQSVPSPKVEAFKMWLAQLAEDRVEEINNPALAAERARQLYKGMGYSDDWIETRLKSIQVRTQLTDEWKDRGVEEGNEFSILTAEIARATFGLLPSEHKKVKDLDKENLRDHMTNLELIFTMLGEEATKQIAQQEDAQGFEENQQVARKGGDAAGTARREFEKKTGNNVVSPSNFKEQINQAKNPPNPQQKLDLEE